MTDTVTITQADRDRAATIAALVGWSSTICVDMRLGVCDAIPQEYPEQVALIQQVAAHRIESSPIPLTEVGEATCAAGLVGRLRQYAGKDWETTLCYNGLRDDAANEIERLSSANARLAGVIDRLTGELERLRSNLPRGSGASDELVERLKRLVPQPSERGGYVGDTFYPVGGCEASHRWDGEKWNWLPELELPESDGLDTIMLGRFVMQYDEAAEGCFIAADEVREVARQVNAAIAALPEPSEETCPICEGREMGLGEGCIAGCRDGKVLWTSANVLRNVKFWMDADRREIDRLRAEPSEALVDALEKIERWFGEFPETGRFWDEPKNTEPMSYAACFGSNGERDFMRGVAAAALAQHRRGS